MREHISYTYIDIPGKNYAIQATLVTQEQWQKVMGNNPSYFKHLAHLPVEMVSWNDCQEFIEKLNQTQQDQQNEYIYRLPTEKEWGHACCAETATDYYWGNEIDNDYCWYNENSNDKTQSVALKKPNPWGFYDMSGNVWEWCEDIENSLRVRRGGSWDYGPRYLRSASRGHDASNFRYSDLGFRLLRIKRLSSEDIINSHIELNNYFCNG